MPHHNQRDKPHARIYAEWERLPAWRTLTPYAKTLYVHIAMRFRPLKYQPNAIEVSTRWAASVIPCARSTAAAAIDELVERGWLYCERAGSTKGPRATRPAVYSLTKEPTDEAPAKKLYLKWRPTA